MNLDQYIPMLGNKDPEQRKKAIIALGKSGDKNALPLLARVHKTDPDPALRDLAMKAGKNIQKLATSTMPEPEPIPEPEPAPASFDDFFNMSTGSSSSNPASHSYASSSTSASQPDWLNNAAASSSSSSSAAPRKISDLDKKKAKGALEQALDASVKKKWQDVAFYLNKAIESNPDMERDSMVLGLAAQITGASGPMAIDALKRMKSEGKVNKPKAVGKVEGQAGFGEFALEWPIWLIAMALVFTASAFGFIRYATNWLDEDLSLTSNEGETIEFDEQGNLIMFDAAGNPVEAEETINIDEIKDFINDYGPITSLAIGVGGGLWLMIYLTVTNYIIWYVGGFMGGTGALFDFLVANLRLDAIWNIGSTILTVGLLIGSVSAANESSIENTSSLSALQCLSGLAGLAFFGVKCWYVGQKHEMGLGAGIGAVFVGSIAASIVFFCCGCALISAAGSGSSASAFLLLR